VLNPRPLTEEDISVSPLPANFIISATDGYPLSARLWSRQNTECPNQIALISAGAGISMSYYDKFARFLAGNDIPTLLYDYRGIGGSRPKTLRGFVASVEDWGSKDCAGALNWLTTKYHSARIVAIGHSVGGFLTGFAQNGNRIERLILVGAHTGYWRDYAQPYQGAMYFLWHMLMPAVTQVVGYFPGRRLHLMNDLPSGVAFEWADRRKPDFWWNRTASNGSPDIQWRDRALGRFHAIHASTLALRFTDDAFATQSATNRILALYQNCASTSVVVSPTDVNSQKIGHFGFFRSRFQRTLWMRVLEWLLR